MNDLISVIIPAYNHENYIQDTINSIISQSYKNLELIILNDGSTDNTDKKILDLFDLCHKRFFNFEYINRENKGYISTLNELVKLAKGKYIYLIASDDIAKSEAIEILYNFINKNPKYGMVVGDNEIINENNEIVYWDEQRNIVKNIEDAKYKTFVEFLKCDRPDVDFNSNDFGSYKSLSRGNYIPNGYLYRQEAIINANGFKENTLEDWYMNLQIARKYKIKYIDKILFSYRWHSNNTIKNKEFIDKLIKNVEKELNEEKLLVEKTLSYKVKKLVIKFLFIFIASKKTKEKIRFKYL